MCHPLLLTGVDMDFQMIEEDLAEVTATVRCGGKTGVEMEALTAVSIGLLTIYDMCKAVQKDMIIEDIKLLSKEGGKSGVYTYEGNKMHQEKYKAAVLPSAARSRGERWIRQDRHVRRY